MINRFVTFMQLVCALNQIWSLLHVGCLQSLFRISTILFNWRVLLDLRLLSRTLVTALGWWEEMVAYSNASRLTYRSSCLWECFPNLMVLSMSLPVALHCIIFLVA